MNMKRIVFASVAILISLIIMGWMLNRMTHVDEINQKRREKDQGEALASRMITTTATTSIWDVLRQTETVISGSPETVPETQPVPDENPEETLNESPEEFTDEPLDSLSEEAAPIPQTFTETSDNQAVILQ